MTRYRPFDDNQITLRDDLDDGQSLRCSLYVAHMPRHFLAFEHTSRRLVLTNRAWGAMGERVAMRCILHPEIVTLDATGKTFTDRRADNVDQLACLKSFYGQFRARLKFIRLIVIQSELE